MSIDATAEALAGDEVAPVTEAPELSEDDQLSAVFDKFQTENAPEPEEEAEEVSETASEAATEDAETAEEAEDVEQPPSEVPAPVRAIWATLSKDARDAIVNSQREMSRKLGEQGRLMQGLKPIQDVLVQAVRDMPHLSDLSPAQAASEMMELAKISRQFNDSPVETLLGLAKKHNIEGAMRDALAGKPVSDASRNETALLKEIETLKTQLQRVVDPEYLRGQVEAITSETRVVDEVTKFAGTAEHWGVVEAYVPDFIPAMKAKLGESASPSDVLKAAYDLAVYTYLPEQKAKPEASEKDAKADPEKAEAALKAKSVNISGKSSGKARKLSESEELGAIYDKVRGR